MPNGDRKLVCLRRLNRSKIGEVTTSKLTNTAIGQRGGQWPTRLREDPCAFLGHIFIKSQSLEAQSRY